MMCRAGPTCHGGPALVYLNDSAASRVTVLVRGVSEPEATMTKQTTWTWVGAALVTVVAMAAEGRAAESAPAAAPAVLSHEAIALAMERVYPALVRINVVAEEPGNGRMNKQQSAGSGAIIRKDGYLITNHHVAGKARRMICRLPDGEEIPGTLVGTDALADIAVIKLDLSARKKNTPLPVAEFGDSDRLRVGDTILAMGSPGGVAQSVTKGIVSNTALILPSNFGALRLDGEDNGSLVRWIAHDAQIYGGNSGGPLVDLEGRIVGINEIAFAGIAGAIPGNLAKSIAEQIIAGGTVRRSWTGIEAQPRPKGSTVPSGVLVAGIAAGSPAAKAGIRAGDIITAYDGAEVNAVIAEDLPVFNALLLSTAIGKTVTAKILREGKTLEVKLATEAREPARGADRELKEWGMTARDFTMMSALEYKRKDRSGVLVSSIRSGGPAATAEPEIRPGDVLVEVDHKPVADLATLQKLTAELTRDRTEPRPVLAGFDRGLTRYLTVAKIGGEPSQEKPITSKKPDFPVELQPLTADLAEALGLPGTNGVRVAYVFPGLSADRAGFKVGDLLVRFDGDAIRAPRPEDVILFRSQVRQYRIGRKVPIDLIRDGKPMTIELTLEEAAATAEEPERYADKEFDIAVRSITRTDRVGQQLPDALQAVMIERVEQASSAALAGVREGDLLLAVEGVATPDVDAARKALKEAAARKARHVVLFVQRGIHTMYLEIEEDWNGSREAKTPAPGKA